MKFSSFPDDAKCASCAFVMFADMNADAKSMVVISICLLACNACYVPYSQRLYTLVMPGKSHYPPVVPDHRDFVSICVL